jgi:LacI family transcriptional regulator
MATIKDVAEHAGVSITTVSHVINQTRYVSEELTQKVYDAMQALDYRPNIVARSLRSGRTRTIGLMIPDISNAFFAEISRKIEDKGFEFGYNMILCNTDESPEKEERYIDVLVAKQVDGLIFISAGDSGGFQKNPYRNEIPVVIADREVEGIESDVVLIDNYAGGFTATKYLISLGHQRIGCISGPSPIRPSANRVEGYRAVLEAAGIPFDPDLLRVGDFRFEGGERCTEDLLNLPDPPTAIFAGNDMMALGAMRVIKRAGLRVPEDISLIGFDNTPLASLVSPQLTTISQPMKEMADLAVELLIEKINLKEKLKHNKDLKPEFKRIVLDTELIIRGSTAVLSE